MRPDELERRLRERLDALGPAPAAELPHVLMLPDFERADRIGEFWGNPATRTFAELLIDCEEDRVLRAALVGTLREAESKRQGRTHGSSANLNYAEGFWSLAGSRVVQIQLDLLAFSRMTHRRG